MCYANFLQDLKLGVAGGQIETAGRLFESSEEEESERMADERVTCRPLCSHTGKNPILGLHSFLASAQNFHQGLSRTCTRTLTRTTFSPHSGRENDLTVSVNRSPRSPKRSNFQFSKEKSNFSL